MDFHAENDSLFFANTLNLDMENGVNCNIILKFNFFGFVIFFHLKIH
jgi:hypothetical protein